jgi:hypothetical protein
VELGLEAERAVINLGGDRQTRYPNSVLVHVTNTTRMHMPEALMPKDAKCLSSQVVDLQRDIFIRVVENG